MIRGVHTMFYSDEADALRAFLRDVIGLSSFDAGGGWPIFELPKADMGVHPTEGQPPSGTHDVSFFCDDIHGTVADLKAKGVEFTQEVEDHGYGFVTYFKMPGGVTVQLYEPKYARPQA